MTMLESRLSVLVCLFCGLLAACGTTPKVNKPAPKDNAIFGDTLADEGDLEGNVKALSARLARLNASNEKYPSTLEGLALAHLALADDLQTRKDDASLKRAESERREAVARFQQLVSRFPDYEGVPASLYIMSVELISLGEGPAALPSLVALIVRFPADTYALDGLIARAQVLIEQGSLPEAEADYAQVIERDGGRSERTAYAHFQLAGISMGRADSEGALDHLEVAATHPAAAADLAQYAQFAAAHVLAQAGRDEAAAKVVIEKLTTNEAQRAALLDAFKKALKSPPR
jgi:tetratricopeptide (TPR) repeat protein